MTFRHFVYSEVIGDPGAGRGHCPRARTHPEPPLNFLLVTLDQFRGDALSCAGHPVVRTPNLDRLAGEGVLLARHFSQSAPCSPGRACLYTGTYQMTNRVVANGTPLDHRFDNVARAARRAGFRPTLFGYTDQGVDPRRVRERGDPRLSTYQGVLPGFDVALDLREDQLPWRAWLETLGHGSFSHADEALESEPLRPTEHGLSAFLTDRLIAWIERQESPFFAHASYFRPHPPYAAAGEFSKRYAVDEVGLPIAPSDDRHPFHQIVLRHPRAKAPDEEHEMRRVRAQYYGMVSDVDHQLGRVVDFLKASGRWEDTYVVVTADHGEQLGDHGLVQKLGFFEESYRILGIVRDPRHPETFGTTVRDFTENVDLFPTLCEAMGLEVPLQCDGVPLTPLLRGESPVGWRTAAHWEYDWRDVVIPKARPAPPWDRTLERHHLAVLRTEQAAYVQFGDGSSLAFDLAADATWRTPLASAEARLALAQEMLVWRSRHLDRTLTGMLLEDGGIGRWPPAHVNPEE